MTFEPARRFSTAAEFFSANGTAAMYLSRAAAEEVCRQSLLLGFLVARIESGIWHDPGFEARFDGIWDGLDPPVSQAAARANNQAAAEFVGGKSPEHDAFVITTAPLTGWTHTALASA